MRQSKAMQMNMMMNGMCMMCWKPRSVLDSRLFCVIGNSLEFLMTQKGTNCFL